MKRSTRNLPDVDLRGRVRRAPAQVSRGRTYTAKMFGGPLDGVEMKITGAPDKIEIGPRGAPFWTYTFAGRQGNVRSYAITIRKLDTPRLRAPNGFRSFPQPRNKRRYASRVLMRAIGDMGRDPRVQAQLSKDHPKVGGRENPRGRGARKRAAR